MKTLEVEDKKIPDDTIYIRTKFAQWNEEEKVFMMDFNGRVKKKSAKNFQLMVFCFHRDFLYICKQASQRR